MLERAAITLLFGLLSFSSFAQLQRAKSNNKSITLFAVNKRPVTVDEFIYLYKKNHHDVQKDFTKEKINEYLQLFVNFKLKVEEARRRGLDTTIVFKKEILYILQLCIFNMRQLLTNGHPSIRMHLVSQLPHL